MKDKYFVSIYVPNSNKSTKQIAYIAKSEAHTLLRNDPNTKFRTRYHNLFSEMVESEINKLTDHKEGVAVFGRFVPNREPYPENIIAIPLPRKPESTKHLGNTYDVAQLLLSSETTPQTLIINIHRDHADIYILESGEFTPTVSVNNLFAIDKENKEYKQRNTITGGQVIHHGSGSGTIEKRIEQENLRFLNDLEVAIPQITPLSKKALANIVIIYTTQFESLIGEFADTLKRKFNNANINLVQKSISSDNEIEKIAKEEVDEIISEYKNSLLEQARETYSLYTEDWKSVEQATQEKRVERLFISLDKASPDMVYQVIRSGGDVVITDQLDIAAKLRY